MSKGSQHTKADVRAQSTSVSFKSYIVFDTPARSTAHYTQRRSTRKSKCPGPELERRLNILYRIRNASKRPLPEDEIWHIGGYGARAESRCTAHQPGRSTSRIHHTQKKATHKGPDYRMRTFHINKLNASTSFMLHHHRHHQRQ